MSDKKKIVVCGAGGHARSVLDIALQDEHIEVVGCIDPIFPQITKMPLMQEIPVIGSDSELIEFFQKGLKFIFIAIGDNNLRRKLYQNAVSIGFEPVNIISRYAVISPKAHLGKGICIMPGAVVNVNTVIGDNCIINTRCSLDHDCNIDAHCHIAPGVAVSGFVKIGEGSHIGTGASVIDRIRIGKGAYIGGGAAVVKDIGNDVLAYGVPAKVIKELKES